MKAIKLSNLIQRILSGALFVVLIVGSIIWSQYAFVAIFAVVTGLTVREFHRLTNRSPEIAVNQWIAIIGGIILFTTSFLHAANIIRYPIFSVYGLYIIVILVVELYLKRSNPIHNWAYFILGQIIIALPFSLLNFIAFIDGASYKPLLLLSVFVIIWVNDIGAYSTGMTFGKHRLFERISPKKSWEGFIGGAILALGAGVGLSYIIPEISLIKWLIFAAIIVLFGTFGDLMESLLKRTIHVKDSGNMMPGHGGLLDRFDSMLLSAPAIFIYLSLIFIS
ncbi:MAG: phosphatidate cytidylyltransferase [Paludibacter sp.]|nr:phosphatidate cytidylyltransferase [Paludibacter sp.]